MRVPKSMVGKVVEIKWVDPISSMKREELDKAKRGKESLASWREWGMVYDVTDGVVVICHSLGFPPSSAKADEGILTRIHEDLIETITTLGPEGPSEPMQAAPR